MKTHNPGYCPPYSPGWSWRWTIERTSYKDPRFGGVPAPACGWPSLTRQNGRSIKTENVRALEDINNTRICSHLGSRRSPAMGMSILKYISRMLWLTCVCVRTQQSLLPKILQPGAGCWFFRCWSNVTARDLALGWWLWHALQGIHIATAKTFDDLGIPKKIATLGSPHQTPC